MVIPCETYAAGEAGVQGDQASAAAFVCGFLVGGNRYQFNALSP
jgi:hypothetical protein